jgi:SAM-dependent methyltransferase
MRFNDDILPRYLAAAPMPLALERVLECEIYRGLAFERPILDIGCGDGVFAAVLFQDSIDTGIDPDARELERAHALGGYDELIECRGDAIPKPDGSYSTIFSNSVLEHIKELDPVLVEAHRLLAPSGRFYVTVPSERFDDYSVVNTLLVAAGLHHFAERWRGFFNRFWRHYHFYALEGWESRMEAAGFVVDASFTYDPRRVCLLNDALVPFSAPSVVVKKLTNRWTLLPSLRARVFAPAIPLLRRILRGGSRSTNGGLVFLSLSKAEP